MVTPESARRVVSSLQRYADWFEYVGSDHRFIVDENQVKQALERQAQLYMRHERSKVKDLHRNLPTDMLTDEERVHAISHILGTRAHNWKEMCLSWTGCEVTMLRNSSLLKMTLKHLNTNHTHGPCNDGDRTMMTLIYEKNEHKEKQARTRIVGSWRHRNWLQCFTGHLAMALFVRLHNDTRINFYKGQPEGTKPSWWEIKLIAGWSNMEAAKSAYTRLLNQCNISWQKVTHMRKSGTEYAGSIGELSPFQIATMSKHTVGESNKLTTAYYTELYAPLLSVMSGFDKDGPYNVPRTRISIGNTFGQNAVEIIFPQYHIWLQQCASSNGDKSVTAQNFLFETLPFLAKVVIQDGCYWIKQFPQHEASMLLLSVMPASYPQFAKTSREWVENQLLAAEQVHAGMLSNAAQESYNYLTLQLQAQEINSDNHFNNLENHIQNLKAEMATHVNILKNAILHIEAMLEVQNPTPIVGPPLVGPLPVPTRQKIPNHQPVAAPPQNIAIRMAPIIPAPNREFLRHGDDPNDVANRLRCIPFVPPFPAKMPCSFKALLVEFEGPPLSLKRYEEASKTHWPLSTRLAYSKRLYLYHQIVSKARRMHGTADFRTVKLPMAAEALDTERKDHTMNVFYTKLKAADSTTKHRVRK
jgi:hypothetical protein